ncbi:hypothetical protein Gpo141_00003532 [Globisporangium polare]
MASEVHDDEDDWLAPTQVAAVADDTPAAATPVPSSRDATVVDERVLCAVCSINLSLWSIQDRVVHMNACLDAAATRNSKYECPTCGKELTDYNEQRRMAHVNMCLDRMCSSNGGSDAGASGVDARNGGGELVQAADTASAARDDKDAYSCMICGVDLSQKDLTARIRHVKQCGQRFGVRPSDMAALQQQQQQERQEGQLSTTEPERVIEIVSDTDIESATTMEEQEGSGDASTNAFAVMMRASSSSSSVLSSTIGRVGQVVSNAFDVLMKSSKTQAVIASSSFASTSSSFRTNNPQQQQTAQGFGKKRKLGHGGSSASTGSSWSTSADSRTRPCPDFKRIRGTQPSFIVDGFKYASKALSSVYFLTHFHSDHYIGLEKSFDCGIIYCNQITAALVVQELRIDTKWVHPLAMNTPVTLHDVQVTLMDANHCPGATIILFRLKNGQAYLHTGDFRYHPKMLSYGPLQSYIPSSSASSSSSSGSAFSRLDGIYLDTTYADPKYTFPTQQTAIDHALELVNKHSLSDKILYLFGSYSIGKERLFMEVAAKHGRKVCVSKAKLKFIRTFGWPESQMKLITTETSATNLHVVPMQDLKMEHLTALLAKHRLRFREIVAIRPTGWTFSKSTASMSTCRTDPTGAIRIYGVPYSEHSSFAELTEFIQKTNPHVIIPTVNCHTEKAAKKQVDAIRQVAFHSISTLFQ